MDILGIILLVKNLILNPKATMKKQKDKNITMKDVIIFIAILKLPALLAIFIEYMYRWETPIEGAFSFGLIVYILSVGGLIVYGYLLNAIASNFKTKTNLMQTMKLAMYAATPMMLLGIINLYVVPYFTYLLFIIAAIYGFYILYHGMIILLETPKEQLMPYFIVSIILFIIGWIIILAIWWQYDSWYFSSYLWDNYYYNGYYY